MNQEFLKEVAFYLPVWEWTRRSWAAALIEKKYMTMEEKGDLYHVDCANSDWISWLVVPGRVLGERRSFRGHCYKYHRYKWNYYLPKERCLLNTPYLGEIELIQ